MEPMVSGRVPLPLRNRVNKQLKEMGSSPTELINKAYEFVDATGSLPHVQALIKPGKRQLTEARLPGGILFFLSKSPSRCRRATSPDETTMKYLKTR